MTEQDKPQMNEREAIVAWLRERSEWYHEKANNPMRRTDGQMTDLARHISEHARVSALTSAVLAEAIERGDHLKGQTDDRHTFS
ncbi:hypothetical protein [Blastomonas sp. UPD001]|uniref:hypothetical protein n=1 Tax=Blastomonas sp. UPD001 TaxID=2217673 RepID=UPI000E34FD29|nr:hypothetical protein [Blastomonas sp. UPD001]